MEITKKDKRDFRRLLKSKEFEKKFRGNRAFEIIMDIAKDKEVQIIISPVASGLYKVDLFGYEDMPEDDLLKIKDMINEGMGEVYGNCTVYEGVVGECHYLDYPN
ncbi:MAG TPA: hypothetical protein GX708_10990 [Gallicola sp.]|nr:hypothetical protein [Gallicola sp.]